MRRVPLRQYVTELIEHTWTDTNADITHAVLDDHDAVDVLCHHLNQAGDGTTNGIEQACNTLTDSLTDNDLDWLADTADNPAAFPSQQTHLATIRDQLRRRMRHQPPTTQPNGAQPQGHDQGAQPQDVTAKAKGRRYQ